MSKSETTKIKNVRFREMDQTGTFMGQEAWNLNDLLRPLRLFDDGGELEKYCLGYLQKKVSSKPLRAYYARKGCMSIYPTILNIAKHFRPSPIAGNYSFVNSHLYLSPSLQSNTYIIRFWMKNTMPNIKTTPKLIQNLVSSNLLRELLFQYIEREVTRSFPAWTRQV